MISDDIETESHNFAIPTSEFLTIISIEWN